ncbi:MAG: hypothetical protein L3J71_03680 [Victivallaceae bacterium]|nr:hypothetical protein [Victivallaceae bacterium]
MKNKTEKFTNPDRNRYYGLRIGDYVEEKVNGKVVTRGTVSACTPADNNCAYVTTIEGEKIKCVAEYCSIIRKVEDMGNDTEQKLLTAVTHVLNRIIDDPKTFNVLGWGTQSFALLTEAYASAHSRTADDVKEQILKAVQERAES